MFNKDLIDSNFIDKEKPPWGGFSLCRANCQAIEGEIEMSENLNVVAKGDFSGILQDVQKLGEEMSSIGKEISDTFEASGASQKELEDQTKQATESVKVLSKLLGVDLPENLGALAAKSAIVGPALEAALPILDVIALGQAVFQVGKELYDAFDMGGQKARQLAIDIGSANREAKSINDNFQVQLERLRQQAAIIEKKPYHNLALEMAEAAQEADRLNKELSGYIQLQEDLAKKNDASFLRQIFNQGFKTDDYQTQIQEHQKWMLHAKDAQGEYNETLSYGNVLQKDLSTLLGKRADLMKILGSDQAGDIKSLDKEIDFVRELISIQQRESASASAAVEILKLKPIVDSGKEGNGGAKVPEAKERRPPVQEKPMEIVVANGGRIQKSLEAASQALKKAMAEDAAELNKMAELSKKLMGEQADNILQAGDSWEKYHQEVKKGAEIRQENGFKLREAQIEADVASGAIPKVSADRQLADLHQQEIQAKIDSLNAELKELESKASKDPVFGTYNDPKQAEKIQSLHNQIDQATGQKQQAAVKDKSKLTQDLAAPYIQASRLITSSFDQSINGWLRGTQTFSQAMDSMWKNMAMGAIESLEKIGQKQLETWILSVAQHKASASKDAEIDAKSAAVKGWKAGWDMPFPVNLFMAPALAAEALSGGIQMACFDVGTPYVPRTGVAMIHEGERIVTAQDNRALMQMMVGGGKRGSDTLNVNHTVNMNGQTDAAFQRSLSRNVDHVYSAVSKAARRRGIGG